MYASGFRQKNGTLYGFSEEGEDGFNHYIILDYFKEKTSAKPQIALGEKLDRIFKDKIRNKQFDADDSEFAKNDARMKSLFSKIKKSKTFK